MTDQDKAPGRPATSLRKIVVEVASRRNQNYLWFNGKLLRGRWSKENIPGNIDDDRFRGMPDLPGLHITVDPDKRVAEISDPLARVSHERLLRKAEGAVLQTFGEQCGPEKRSEYRDLSEDDLKTWLYWLVRLCWGKCGEVVDGRLPTMDEVLAMPGRVRQDNFTTDATVDRYRGVQSQQKPPDIPDHPDDVLVDAEFESRDRDAAA